MAGTIWCYAPQRRAVEEFIRSVFYGSSSDAPCAADRVYAPPRIVSVDEHSIDWLRGHSDITFAVVLGHQHQIPSRLYLELQICGATMWNFDDGWKRARYNARNPHGPRT